MTGNKRPGFSMIEMLVVTLIFGLASVILSQIFVSFNNLHRRVSSASVLGQDMRFAMELMVREARNDAVDYSQTILAKDTSLYLVKPNGTKIVVAKRTSPQTGCDYSTGISACIALSTNGGTTWNQITSGQTQVTGFDVYTQPTANPFQQVGGSYPNNVQPFVTINLALKSMNASASTNVSLQAQTTVSSRKYVR